ncbi:DUF2059 domain-containing protein [Acidobacterium sp. S8]|uniref:DUF2059 domain-containing protein n=1 Tax=Acidobacterium sp. S8 TaxID=1641854 RepID=UPI00131EBEF1|nr:DUF2059 domain-containing protein [Acidobacterium sp. S8]
MRIFQGAICAAFLSTSLFAQQAATSPTPKSTTSTAQSASSEPAIKPPTNPITAAQIAEMQRLTGAAETKKRIVESAMEYYRRSFPPYIPQDVVEDLEKSLRSADIESHAAQIYPKYISTEDATHIIEFYKSPSGQRLIQAQPYLMTEIQRSAIEVAQQTAKDVITRHKAEIEAAQQKFMQDRQQAKPSLNTPSPSPSTPSTPNSPQK